MIPAKGAQAELQAPYLAKKRALSLLLSVHTSPFFGSPLVLNMLRSTQGSHLAGLSVAL